MVCVYKFVWRKKVILAWKNLPPVPFPTLLPALLKKTASKSTLTAGLVGDFAHETLPTISPGICAILTLLAMAPALYKTFSKFSIESWLTSYCSCALASFLFGWHVHEKAILLVVVPMTGLIFIQSSKYFRPFIILSTAGLSGLLPLIYTQFEQVSLTSVLKKNEYRVRYIRTLRTGDNFFRDFWGKNIGELSGKTGRATILTRKTVRATQQKYLRTGYKKYRPSLYTPPVLGCTNPDPTFDSDFWNNRSNKSMFFGGI